MWDFDIVHIAGKKNVVADALLRRLEPEGWELPKELEEDVEDFIDAYLNAIQLLIDDALALEYSMCRADLSVKDEPLEGNYSKEL
jgi:hypothetical protein